MKTAKAYGNSMSISTRQSINIADSIRHRSVARAKKILEDSIDMKRAIPFKKHTNGLGHKPGMSAGRFVPTACSQILALVKSAESNAKNLGMNTDKLVISKISASKAAAQYHYGRQGGRKMKRTNLIIELAESEAADTEAKKAKKRSSSKKETKPEVKA